MSRLRYLALALLIGGAALFAYAIAVGQGSAGLFIVFPFFVGTGPFALLGMLLVFASIFIYFLSFGADVEATGPMGGGAGPRPDRESGSQVRHGGFVLIGPIPIVWGSDRSMFWVSLVMGLVMVAIIVFLFLL